MKKHYQLFGGKKAEYPAPGVLYPFLSLFSRKGKTMKLSGTRKRQIMASVLAFALIATMLPFGALTTLAAGTNLLVNPGGEIATADYGQLSSNGWMEDTSPVRGYSYTAFVNFNGITLAPKSGNYFMAFYATGGAPGVTYPDGVSCYQDIAIAGQPSFSFSGYASLKKDSTGSAMTIIEALDGSGNVISTFSQTVKSSDGDWKQVTLTGAIPTGTAKLRVSIKGILNSAGLAAFDDLSLTLGDLPAVTLKLGDNGAETPYESFSSAWTAALALETSASNRAILTLGKNITDAAPVKNSGDYITLNTNGKTLSFYTNTYTAKITNEGGELSIIGSGMVTAPNDKKPLLNITGGTANLTDATLKHLGTSDTDSICVLVGSGAVFNMLSGTVESVYEYALRSYGTANIYSGILKGSGRYVALSENYANILFCPSASQTVLIQNNGNSSNSGNCGGLLSRATINGQGMVRVEAQSGYTAYNGVRNYSYDNNLKFISGTLIVDISKGNTTAGYGAFNAYPLFDESTLYQVWAGSDEAGAALVSSPTAATYTANNYVKIQSTGNRYAVTLNENGGSYAAGYTEPTTYDKGTGLTLPTGAQIAKTNYTFLGWTATNDVSDTNYITAIPADATGVKTYYAKWQTNKYKLTVKYKFANGTDAAPDYSADVDYNSPYSVSSPAITGYTTDKTTVSGTMGTAPVTVTVTYTPNTYAVQYNANTGSWNSGYSAPSSYTFGVGLTLPTGAQITKTGYAFRGWTETNNVSDTAYITAIPTDATGTKTYYAKWADVTAPTGDVKIGTNSIKKLLNTLTFGWFFKDTTEVTITAQDTSGESVTIAYYLSETELTDVGAITSWTAYSNKITLTANRKVIVYAQLTDPSGNVTVINSDGVVIFTDSTATTSTVSFTKASTTDASATINLNGNTIKAVSLGGNMLVKNTDYTVSGGTITIKASYLNTLAAGNYSLSVSYYPYGETATAYWGSNTPASTLMSLSIAKAASPVLIVASPTGSQTRPYSVTLSAALAAGATGTVQFKANGVNIGTPVAVGQTVSFTASGPVNNYVFTASYSGDNTFNAADSIGLAFSFIKGEQSALSFAAGTPTVKTYGDAAFAITATGGSGTGTIAYSVVSGPATVNGNTVTLTGAGTVILRATKAADNDYNAKSVEHTITVNPKSVTITGLTALSKTYDGSKTATVSGTAVLNDKVSNDNVSVVTGTASFADKAVGNGKTVTFTGFALSGSDAGKYTLSSQPASVTADITAKPITMNVTVQSKAYDGLNTAAIASATLNDIVSGDAVSLVTPYPSAAFAAVTATNNIAVSFNGSFTLTGADAGNYLLTQPSGIKSSIVNEYHAAKGTDYTVNQAGWSKADFVVTAKSGFELSLTDTTGGVWSDTLTKSEETSNGSLTFYVRNKTTGAISLAAAESYQIDKTAPTGDMAISASSIKKVLNAITFGLFFKDTQSITVTSADAGSGVASVVYKLSSTVLEENAVSEISDWTEYTGTLSIEPDSQTVVYVKITDTVGNTVYLGSDGLVLDGTAPVIGGIENGKAYCAAVSVTVTDANLDVVTVNGVSTALTDGKFTLSPTGSAQTVVATDKAGNSTTVTVTVYDGHAWNEGVVTIAPTTSQKGVKTYTCTHCGETRTEEIDRLAPSITDGQSSQWKQGEDETLTFKSDALFSDFIRVLVDGKVIDAENYDVKEDGVIITLKARYLATLSAGKHTLGICFTTGTASAEFLIEAKSDDTSIPKTGDNSHIPLLVVLLLSAGAAISLGTKGQKRKAL